MKEQIYKIDKDYIDFRLKGYRVIILRIDDKKTGIEIRKEDKRIKGSKDKRLFYESVERGFITK